jgi:anti-sigma factor RsiW
MNHASIRALLPLAAAGALGPEEVRQVEQHVRECPDCRKQAETWGAYGASLRQLPQPQAPLDLIQRTQARIVQEQALRAEARFNAAVIGSLAVFSTVTSAGFWLLARFLSGGTFEILGINLVHAGPWFVLSSIVAWTTAGVAAAALGAHRDLRRTI